MSSLAPGQAPLATERPPGQPMGVFWVPLNRLRGNGLDLRNTWQIVAGALLLPAGIAVILIGWSGAAHGRVDQQQIPYLISGGILGLALVVIGCFFFWAHWLYRIYDQADLHRQVAMNEHNELLRALVAAVGQQPAEVDGQSAAAAVEAAAASFVATPTGTNFHIPECPIVSGRTGSLRPISMKQAAKMKPCRICEPSVSGR